MRERVESSKIGRFIFYFFWCFLSKVSPSLARKWILWGLGEGAFERISVSDDILVNHLFDKTFKTPFGIFCPFLGAENVIDSFIDMGFSFGEFGPYTLNPQKGFCKIKFLTKKQGAVFLADSYPNSGLLAMVPFFLKRRRFSLLTGVNLISGIDAESPSFHSGGTFTATEELENMVQKIAPYCEYIVVNVAHPSTEFYETVGNHEMMLSLIKSLKEKVHFIAPFAPPKILMEVPYDLTAAQLLSVGEIARESVLDGVVLVGPHILTRSENPFRKSPHPAAFYGVGDHKKIVGLIQEIYRQTHGEKIIIAAGGMSDAQDAFDILSAGASLIRLDMQVFFNGPMWISKLNRDLSRLIRKNGFNSIQEIIGTSVDKSDFEQKNSV